VGEFTLVYKDEAVKSFNSKELAIFFNKLLHELKVQREELKPILYTRCGKIWLAMKYGERQK